MAFVSVGTVVRPCEDTRTSVCRHAVVRAALAGGSEDWAVVDFDPSHWGGGISSSMRRAKAYYQDMPLSVRNRQGSGMWQWTGLDLSRAQVEKSYWVDVAFDETHIDEALVVNGSIFPPKQIARPERAGTGIWSQTDWDPSRMPERPLQRTMVDVDPSSFSFVSTTSRKASFRQRCPPVGYAQRAEGGQWSDVSLDESSFGNLMDVWTSAGVDLSSVGFVARNYARLVSHALQISSMSDSDGILTDVDPSCMEYSDKKVRSDTGVLICFSTTRDIHPKCEFFFPAQVEDPMWSLVDWDETHDSFYSVTPSHSETMIPSTLLRLMDENNRVVLETVAGGTFIIIARSGGEKARRKLQILCPVKLKY